MTKKFAESSSCSRAGSTIFIGRNGRGNWVAREQSGLFGGLFGGLFVTRAGAFKYALVENGHHPEAIVEVSFEMELNIPAEQED